ncbi:MAG TPA: CsiV family protein [Steroidobacteraceae bacterium]|nr:CsiV family protein [Steroidobacteraceae bacterium]
MNRRLRLLSAVLLAVCSGAIPALAQDAASPAYRIELIVFRTVAAQGGAENWSTETGAANIIGEESAGGSSQVGHFIALLPPEQYQLNDIESRLRASGAYVPVAHFAWSQTASGWGTRAGFPLQKLGVDVQGLNGNVFLERGQYLHLGMSLSYAIAAPPAALGAGPGTVFTLTESRRIRFYERNYYDHPAFGVIALVTPAQGARPAGR